MQNRAKVVVAYLDGRRLKGLYYRLQISFSVGQIIAFARLHGMQQLSDNGGVFIGRQTLELGTCESFSDSNSQAFRACLQQGIFWTVFEKLD